MERILFLTGRLAEPALRTADIVAFLETLSGPFPTQQMPRLPPTPGDLID